jgi:biotin carboxylase
LPVVVKPCSLSGSRGVIRANSATEARAAAERIRAILDSEAEPPDSPLLVESFVPGPEVAVEAIMRGGTCEIITVFDKPDPLDGPFFEETLYLSPSHLRPDLLHAVWLATEDAVTALGLTEGPFHAELRVPGALASGGAPGDRGVPGVRDVLSRPGAPGTVKVLEVAARTIGGRCSKAMRLEDGSSLEELVIANALGIAYPQPRLASPCGILMIPIPNSGVLASVDGVEEVRALPGVTGVDITIPLGRPVKALPEGDRYLGFVFAAAETRALVESALREAGRLLRVHIVNEPVEASEAVEKIEPAEPRGTLA